MSGKTRTFTEWRVLSQRVGNPVTEKRYRSMKSVMKRIGLLTSPEPWRFYETFQSGDERVDDDVRRESEERRAALPALESVRVESRQVTTTPWESTDLDGPAAGARGARDDQ